jgi:hypothetical protein
MNMLGRFDYEGMSRQRRPLLAEDVVFTTASFGSAAAFDVVHTELRFEEGPMAVVRDVYLQHAEKPHTSLQLTLALAWDGFPAALTLALRFVSAYQRAIPEAAIVNTAVRENLGDFGVAWAWEGRGEPDVVAFVRHNVLVGIQGHDTADHALALARELDRKLSGLATTNDYHEAGAGLAAEVRRRDGDVPRVAAGGRLDLGVPPEGKATFFLSSDGSVNRDPSRPSLRYLRAGVETGRREIRMFTVGEGILPTMERLIVDVV